MNTYSADNRCVSCGSHIADPHAPDCSFSAVDEATLEGLSLERSVIERRQRDNLERTRSTVLRLVASGESQTRAARLAGVSRKTVNQWVNGG